MSKNSSVSRRQFVAGASVAAVSASMGCATETKKPLQPKSRSGTVANAALTRSFTVPTPPSSTWPVLARYDADHLTRIAMPIGGIGTGTISLGGRGDLRNWELVNRPAKGYTPPNTFFAIWMKGDGEAMTRALEGPLDVVYYEGASGAAAPNHNLPRFRHCNFAAAYPLGQVLLSDPELPLLVRIEAFNPMIPGDTENSGIPIVAMRFVLINPTNKPIDASIAANLENFIGWDGAQGKTEGNKNHIRSDVHSPVRGLFMQSKVDPSSPAWGTLAISTDAKDVTYRTAWADLGWGDTLLDWWDDFSADGKLDPRDGHREPPFGSITASTVVPAKSQATLSFFVTWHFPNRLAWNAPGDRVGNYYTTQYADAWDVAVRTVPNLPHLEDRTVQFVKALTDSDMPPVLKEAALFNASTLRTQTTFRIEDGTFFGWEGCNDHDGWCEGSCTHVWNYEQATAFLYGKFARMMRRVEFAHATRDDGSMSFRVHLPLKTHATDWQPAAADGQMGTLMKLYRDWRMSGDDAMLKELWPHARKALEFAWIEKGWDANQDGVMEGCQHNTMDVEYYGPNPEVGTWYLGALRASEEMAKYLGDTEFAAKCHDLFARGSKWVDENLFNGEFYEHHIVPAAGPDAIANHLRAGSGASDPAHPTYQVGPACMCDQLVGQYMAHICGLGYLLDQSKVKTTLASIMKYNFKTEFFNHFNHLRSYALNDESGVLVATYPRGNRPQRPFPYCNEVWTGLEYTAAAGMIYEGMHEDGLKVVSATRNRHDGNKRNPFDEPECGHHYARAMASWATIIAFTGFHYDGVDQVMGFRKTSQPAKWFWSNGDAWGSFRQKSREGKTEVTLEVMGGSLRLKQIQLNDGGSVSVDASGGIEAGKLVRVVIG